MGTPPSHFSMFYFLFLILPLARFLLLFASLRQKQCAPTLRAGNCSTNEGIPFYLNLNPASDVGHTAVYKDIFSILVFARRSRPGGKHLWPPGTAPRLWGRKHGFGGAKERSDERYYYQESAGYFFCVD